MGGACCPYVACLQPDEQLVITSLTDKTVENGPKVAVVGVGKTSVRKKATVIGPGQYILVKNTLTGKLRNVEGPCQVFLGPYDKILETRTAVALQHNEYIRLVDDITGKIRVEIGPQAVYRSPTESVLEGGKKKAIEIDSVTAVIVTNTLTGAKRLVTKEQLFVPSPVEAIHKVRNLIKLAEYETVIVKDESGKYHFVSGSSQPENHSDSAMCEKTTKTKGETKQQQSVTATGESSKKSEGKSEAGEVELKLRRQNVGKDGKGGGVSFFLPPYCELVKLLWSTGPKKTVRSEKMSVFDSRPRFDNYEFICRTSDNVELDLEITFFWSLENVQAMVNNTDDAPGDICHHARSEIVQVVSQIDLKTFMQKFNAIINDAVIGSGDMFYSERGVKVHSVEVRSFQCRDKAIDKVLQQIIKETTDRINRLQKVESENEVQLEKMKGMIQEEKMKGGLIEVRNSHMREEALVDGAAEAERVGAFVAGLQKVMSTADAIKIFQMLRKVDTLNSLSSGDARLFFTPNDCDLRIGVNDWENNKRGGDAKTTTPSSKSCDVDNPLVDHHTTTIGAAASQQMIRDHELGTIPLPPARPKIDDGQSLSGSSSTACRANAETKQ